jgi:hypothetical protein
MAKGIIPDRVVPMRVIVCGLQRTGTLSTSILTNLQTLDGCMLTIL